MVEGPTCGTRHVAPFDYGSLRRRFSRAYITNNGYDLDPATSHLAEVTAKLIAFGRPFIANPDLVDRLQSGVPLTEINPVTLYGGAGCADCSGFTGTSGS